MHVSLLSFLQAYKQHPLGVPHPRLAPIVLPMLAGDVPCNGQKPVPGGVCSSEDHRRYRVPYKCGGLRSRQKRPEAVTDDTNEEQEDG